MSAITTRALLIGALSIQLAACGHRTTTTEQSAPQPGTVVEETMPPKTVMPRTGAGAPVGLVQSRMSDGTAPSTGTVPTVVSTMSQGYTAPPTAPMALNVPDAPVDGSATTTATESGPAPRPREIVTAGQVCAAAIGMLFGRDPSNMQVVSDAGGLTRVKYSRSDQTTWTNECRITDRTVTWRAIGADGPGRWRTEDAITYLANTSGLAMTVNGETRAFAR